MLQDAAMRRVRLPRATAVITAVATMLQGITLPGERHLDDDGKLAPYNAQHEVVAVVSGNWAARAVCRNERRISSRVAEVVRSRVGDDDYRERATQDTLRHLQKCMGQMGCLPGND